MAEVTTREVLVPDIGDFTDVPVIEVLVEVGATVAPEDPLIVLESDKATMEVPSPAAGTVESIASKVGDEVSQGDLILTLTVSDTGETPAKSADSGEAQAEVPDEAREPAREAATDEAEEPEQGPAAAGSSGRDSGPVYAGPGARRLARELEVDIAAVEGTGRKGRITKEDVQAAAEGGRPQAAPLGAAAGAPGGLPPWPEVDFAAYGQIETAELSRIKRIAGPALTRNWIMIPHVTQHDEADITELEAFRKEINAAHADDGVKLTMVSLLIKACASALRAFPEFNSSLAGDQLVLKRYTNIGFAVDTPGGLLVPVIRDADRKGLLEIARELVTLSSAAREGTISAEDMRGGTFTITSLGGIGGTSFTPIINAPEVAILGVSRSAMKPVWVDGEFQPRLMLPLSLSYDHRVIDGAAAARFTTHLGTLLSDARRMLL
ncbi:MAG: dihydrolipoyllysine-residue acetyltransferase [Thermoleophilia bacterium]